MPVETEKIVEILPEKLQVGIKGDNKEAGCIYET